MTRRRPRVSVIVPTLAQASRAASLVRAIESVKGAVRRSEDVDVIVVVNGQRRSAQVVAWLQRAPVRVLWQDEGSAPLAVRLGRGQVETECFSILDDDDEYLAGALERRLQVLEGSDRVDVVVTNGWRRVQGRDEPVFRDIAGARADPMMALLDENWLASCGALFRTSTVGVDYFGDGPGFVEWTWLAFRLALDGRCIEMLDEPTFRIHDTPESASKSRAYSRELIEVHERMLLAATRADIRARLVARIQNLWHQAALSRAAGGDRRGAWNAYREVWCYPGAWRYLGDVWRIAIAPPQAGADS